MAKPTHTLNKRRAPTTQKSPQSIEQEAHKHAQNGSKKQRAGIKIKLLPTLRQIQHSHIQQEPPQPTPDKEPTA
jgi:hypothetical protein